MDVKGSNWKNLALCSVLIFALGFIFLMPINHAYAVTASDFTIDQINNEVFYQESIDTYVILAKNSSASHTTISFMDAGETSPNTDITSHVIYPQSNGCNEVGDPNQNNPCDNNDGSADCDSSGFHTDACSNYLSGVGTFGGLWCGLTYCYVLYEDTGSALGHQLLRIWSLGKDASDTGDISGYMNITGNQDLHPYLWGYDEASGGLGGITIFYVAEDSGSALGELYTVGGTFLMGIANNVALTMFTESGSGAGVSLGMVDLDGCRHCGGDISTTRVIISIAMNDGTSTSMKVVNENGVQQHIETPDSIDSDCTGLGVLGVTANTGAVKYLGGSANKFMVMTNTGAYTYHVVSEAISCHDYDAEIVNYPRNIQVDTEDNYLYISHGSTASLQSLTRYNLTLGTSGTALSPISFEDINEPTISSYMTGGQLYHSMAIAPDIDTILLSDDTSRMRLLFLEEFEETGTGGEPNSEICFVVQATGQSICYPTDENGNPIVNSLVEPAGAQNPIYHTIGGYVCQIGFFDQCTSGQPTNTNIETNGIGYLMWFMTWAIMTAVMGVAFFGTIKKTPLIGLIPMMVVLFISTALGVILNWIPERDFYIVVFIVIGFAGISGTKLFIGQTRGGGGSE